MAQMSFTKCGFCEKENGTFYCRDCECFYCQTCKPVHDKFPANKQHTIIDASKEGRHLIKPKLVCGDHKKEYLYYCKDCDCLICSECIITVHNLHPCCDYKNIVDQRRQNVIEIIGTIKAKVQIMEESLNTIKSDTLPQINSATNDFENQVNAVANEIGSVIDDVKHIYKTRASDFRNMETEKITNMRSSLECVQNQYKDVLLKFEHVLQEPHGVTFFFEQKAIQKEIDNLDKIPEIQKADLIPDLNPDIFIDQIINKLDEKFEIRTLEEKKKENEKLKKMIEEAEHNLKHEIARLEKKNKDDTSQLNETLLKERTKLSELQTEFDRMTKSKTGQEWVLSQCTLEEKMIEEAEHNLKQEIARLEKKNKDDTSQLNETLLKERTKLSELQTEFNSYRQGTKDGFLFRCATCSKEYVFPDRKQHLQHFRKIELPWSCPECGDKGKMAFIKETKYK